MHRRIYRHLKSFQLTTKDSSLCVIWSPFTHSILLSPFRQCVTLCDSVCLSFLPSLPENLRLKLRPSSVTPFHIYVIHLTLPSLCLTFCLTLSFVYTVTCIYCHSFPCVMGSHYFSFSLCVSIEKIDPKKTQSIEKREK